MVVIIATMNLFDTKFLYFNSGICVLAHLHLVVPPGVNLTLVCKNSLRICEKKKIHLKEIESLLIQSVTGLKFSLKFRPMTHYLMTMYFKLRGYTIMKVHIIILT